MKKRVIFIFCLGLCGIVLFLLFHNSAGEKPFKGLASIEKVFEWYPIEKELAFTEKEKRELLKELKKIVAVKEEDNNADGFWGIQFMGENGEITELNIVNENIFQYGGIYYKTDVDMMELHEKYFD